MRASYDAVCSLGNGNFRGGRVHTFPIAIKLGAQLVDWFKVPPAFYADCLRVSVRQSPESVKISSVTVQYINAIKSMLGEAGQNTADKTLIQLRAERNSARKAHVERGRRIADFWCNYGPALSCRGPRNFTRTDGICADQTKRAMLFNRSGWQYNPTRSFKIGLYFAPRHFFKFHANFMTPKREKRKANYELACTA